MHNSTQSLILLYLHETASRYRGIGGWAKLTWLRDEFGLTSSGEETERLYDALEALVDEGLVEVRGLLLRVTDLGGLNTSNDRLRLSLLAA